MMPFDLEAEYFDLTAAGLTDLATDIVRIRARQCPVPALGATIAKHQSEGTLGEFEARKQDLLRAIGIDEFRKMPGNISACWRRSNGRRNSLQTNGA